MIELTNIELISHLFGIDESDLIAETHTLMPQNLNLRNDFANQWSRNNESEDIEYYKHSPKLYEIIKIIKEEEERNFSMDVTLRLIRPHHHVNWDSQKGPHFDGPFDAKFNAYIVASEPTTVQYSGKIDLDPTFQHSQWLSKDPETVIQEQNLIPASILPMKLYRMNQHTMHSIPWNWMSEKMRFFLRVTCWKHR